MVAEQREQLATLKLLRETGDEEPGEWRHRIDEFLFEPVVLNESDLRAQRQAEYDKLRTEGIELE